MTRGGTTSERPNGPERKCIATGDVLPQTAMVRFVVSPDDTIVPDILGKLPGRGIWVTANRAALEKAAGKNLFARAAKTKVSVPDGLPDLVETQLARRVVDLISLMRKSGDAVSGYEKVKDCLTKEEARVLIQATDGSERGKSKLSTPGNGTYIGWLTASELGLAFGRQTVIHAALRAGGLDQRVVDEARRLRGVRIGSADATRGQGAARKDKRS